MFAPKRLLLFAALLLKLQLLQSQSYDFRHYQVEDGLSNNAVICSLQDKMGFLWFGTKDGLNRFDGYSFKIFRNSPNRPGSIGSNFIHSLHQDAGGTLWVGAERGLYRYDATTEQFSLVPATANFAVNRMTTDARGNLWLVSGFTLYRYNITNGQVEVYPVDRFFEATSLCTTPDGALWVSTSNGTIRKYQPASNSFVAFDLFRHAGRTGYRWIERIHSTADGLILVGTSNAGAKIFNPATGDYTDMVLEKGRDRDLFVRNFVQTGTNEYWIGTESGIYIYNKATGKSTHLHKRYTDPFSLSDNAVYTFCKDREGGIWAGTYFGGVNYYPKQYTPFKKLMPRAGENSLSGNVVREMRQDAWGNLWIGTEDAGLNRWHPRTGTFTHYVPDGRRGSLSYSNIHGLLVDGNELWVGTFEHGLDVLDSKTGKVIRRYSSQGQPELKSNFIYTIYKAGTGDIMIGTTIGLYVYQRQKDAFTPLPGMPLYNWYTAIFRDAAGTIWAGTYGNGVHRYNPQAKAGRNFRHNAADKSSLSSDRVNSIFEDSNKNLWFATEDGLCRWNRDTENFTRYTTANGFPSNFTISILEDDDKNLWISTTKGLVRFHPQSGALHVFTVAHGLLSDQFNFSSAYKDSTGRMYFGSARGLISFHPSEFSRNSFTPPVYITGFQVNNREAAIATAGSPLAKSITYTQKVSLAHDQSTFSIDFAGLSYTAPETAAYAYKMEGLDKDWTYLNSNRKVYFTGLSPGSYVFQVKAANSSGIWNGKVTSLAVDILPPWWASAWAYAAYILVGLHLIYYLIHSYHKGVEERNRRKIELLETAKEKEIFQAKIEFFTNVAHEIRTPLTLIKGPLEKVMKKAGDIPDIQNSLRIMNRNTNRLIELTSQLLDFRQTEIKGFSLNFVQANVSELLDETFSNFMPLAEEKGLQFALELPPERLIVWVDVEAFNKILCNLFSNAVKYAETEVRVRLLDVAEGENLFRIELKNDGHPIPYSMQEKIFEPFVRLKETAQQKGTGIGLALSRSLAQLHKGMLQLQAPDGLCNVFVLSLPIHQEIEFNLSARRSSRSIAGNVNNQSS